MSHEFSGAWLYDVIISAVFERGDYDISLEVIFNAIVLELTTLLDVLSPHKLVLVICYLLICPKFPRRQDPIYAT